MSLLKEMSGTQMMMKTRRRRLPTVQTVSRKRKKLDPDDFLLEGKSVARPAELCSSPNHSMLSEHFFTFTLV